MPPQPVSGGSSCETNRTFIETAPTALDHPSARKIAPAAPVTSGAVSDGLREPMNPTDVALRRDEAADRTKERNRSGVVDALRATAAMMVLVDHTGLIAAGPTPGTVATAVRHTLAAGVF